jgi:hypothetical protein
VYLRKKGVLGGCKKKVHTLAKKIFYIFGYEDFILVSGA